MSFHNATFLDYADFEAAEFGQAAFKRINFRSVEFGKTLFRRRVEFVEVDFPGWVTFQGMVAEGDTTFLDCRFRQGVSFQHAKFERNAAFSARFGYDVDVFDVTFGRKASFAGTEFAEKAFFVEATFEGDADLSEVKFNGDTFFDGSKFARSLVFEKAMFEGNASLRRVSFPTKTSFVDAHIVGRSWIESTSHGGTLDISSLRVDGVAEITGWFENVRCEASEFGERAWFRLAAGELRLDDSSFAGPTTVEFSPLPVLAEAASSTPVPVQLRSMRGTNADHLTLIDVDLSRCELAGLRRPELLHLVGSCRFASMPRGVSLRWGRLPWRWSAREATFEEHLWRRSVGAPASGVGWAAPSPGEEISVSSPERLAVIYRQLRTVLENSKNEPGAADFYYGEMEMCRAAARRGRRAEKYILTAYWMVSGYGLRASRALLILIAVMLSSAAVLRYAGFPGITADYRESLLFASGAVLSLDLTNAHLSGTLTDWGDVVRIVLRLAGPVLLGLAALAIRGRIKR